MTSLADLLSRSDFISINCTLNPSSYHLINANTLEFCKPGAVLINTPAARFVEETALIAVLRDGLLRGAALDVLRLNPCQWTAPC